MTPLRHAEQKQAGNLDGQQSAPFHFECPLTVFKADSAPEGKKRRIAGIISTDSSDRQNERILQDGLSFDDFIQHGWFNDNHSAATTDILGYPESVKQFDVGDALPDGSTASAKGTWVEGYLLDTKKANDVWELAQSLAKTHRRLGYSVEGAIEDRTGPNDSTIAKAKVRNVAITNCPVNTDSRLEILARSLSAHARVLKRAMTLADSSGSAGPAKPNKAYTGQGAGQVLSRESFGTKPKKKRKSATLTRSEAVAYVQAQMPGCSEALARAIVLRTIQSNHP